MIQWRWLIISVLVLGIGYLGYQFWHQHTVYQQIIARLTADSRAAEVLVTGVNFDESAQRIYTTVKFLEYDSHGKALEPKYFTFPGKILQFQSLVVRFDDRYVKMGSRLRGKSAYLFLKAFALNGPNTKEFVITPVDEIPSGYKIGRTKNAVERRFWQQFWRLTFDPAYGKQRGIKNVQIEAPGTMFIPGYLYTIRIEHDGGLRIDTKRLPEIIVGEKILK